MQEMKFNSSDTHSQEKSKSVLEQKLKHENGFSIKSRALKICGYLKKAKLSISRSFFNCLFTAGNPMKPKISPPSVGCGDDERKSKSSQVSMFSIASSFSKSCLSETLSSIGKPSNDMKKVRFHPVIVIFDEDCRPAEYKCLYEDEPNLMAGTVIRKIGEAPLHNEELHKLRLMESRRFEEAIRDLLKGFQKKLDFDMRDLDDANDEEDYDDAASYSSSDLFELHNVAATGIDGNREDPVVVDGGAGEIASTSSSVE